jgi:hypothetical protein
MGIHLSSLCAWWGKDNLAWYCAKCFCNHCEKCMISCFVKANPCPFSPCPIIFTPLNQYCVVSRWCLHIGKRCHCWPDSSWSSFTCCLFLWGYDNSCSSGKGRFLSWSIPNGHVCPSSCGGFWMSTLASERVLSLMCQHGVGSKRH